MSGERRSEPSSRTRRSGRLAPVALMGLATACLAYVAHLVARQTVDVVQSRGLLPRWDLATHLGHGWFDYHLLATGRIDRLLWDLWLQGYWPPLPSVYQIPFYLLLGSGIAPGLWSALAAFLLVGLIGTAVLWRQRTRDAALPAALFLGLLISSPYLLAYASVTMTEMPGAAAQLLVLLCYVGHRQRPGLWSARLFAMSLTVLFFTKYNYFLMLGVPLVLHEWLEWGSGRTIGQRLAATWRGACRILFTPTGMLLALYLLGLVIVLRSGGFDFRLFGQRVSVHSVGNSGHVVLYLLLARVWYLHRRGRIDWARITSADPRARALLAWFVLPVTIWFASPYPNHIRDFFNLVVNRPLGDASVGAGIEAYTDALRSDYFYSEWVFVLVAAVVVVAAIRFRRQPPLMRWLILAIPLQLAAIALHQTRFPRFLLLTVVLVCLVAANEAGGWFAGPGRRRLAGALLAPIVAACGIAAATRVVMQERFRAVAFENYTDSHALRRALDEIRTGLTADDRLAIVGQGNELSPALFRWQLGPPSGVPCFPFEIGGAAGQEVAGATRLLLIVPSDPALARIDDTPAYRAQRRTALELVERGELLLRREIRLDDMQVALRLYDRPSATPRLAECQ